MTVIKVKECLVGGKRRRGEGEERGQVVKQSLGPCRWTLFCIKSRLKAWSFVLILKHHGCSLDAKKSVNHFYKERLPRV